jgi:DNA-3-methyladenine glycosylase
LKIILQQKFFNRPTLKIAKELLGKFLVRKNGKNKIAGMITETEAYVGPEDKASHASRLWRGSPRAARGKTERTKVMFGKAGQWYVYLIYGMHYCLNIVTEKENYPAAILIRSVAVPRKHSNILKQAGMFYGRRIAGPGRVCKYFKIDKKFNAKSADTKTGLWIEDRGVKINSRLIKRGKSIGVDRAFFLDCPLRRFVIKRGKRIGVDYAGRWKDKPWRFYLVCAR